MSTAETERQGPDPVADLSYEQARDELVRLVSRIESGQVPLEEAMTLWERGEQLAAHCQAKLDAAQDTLDRATGQGAKGAPAASAGPATARHDSGQQDSAQQDDDGQDDDGQDTDGQDTPG